MKIYQLENNEFGAYSTVGMFSTIEKAYKYINGSVADYERISDSEERFETDDGGVWYITEWEVE